MTTRSVSLRARSAAGVPVTPIRHDRDPTRVALVVCDMWDRTQCVSAVRRVAETAPRVSEIVFRLHGPL